MAWSLVGSVGNHVIGSGGASITPAYGQTPTAGNLLVLLVAGMSGTSNALPATPSGWTEFQQVAGAANVTATCYWKIAAGGDAQPTIAGLSGVQLVGQLMEWNPGSGTIAADQGGTGTATTTSGVATAGAADAVAGDVVFAAGSAYFTSAATQTLSFTFNNGTSTTVSANNNANSAKPHYAFGYGVTTGNASPDSATLALSNNPQNAAVLIASFTASSNVDAAVTAAALNGTGDLAAPTVSSTENATITAATLAGTGDLVAPSTSATGNATVTAAVLAGTGDLTAPAVTATAGLTINATTLAATGDLVAPAVSATRSATVNATTLNGTGDLAAPAVTATDSITVNATPIAGTGDLPAPHIANSSTATHDTDRPIALAVQDRANALAVLADAALTTQDLASALATTNPARTLTVDG